MVVSTVVAMVVGVVVTTVVVTVVAPVGAPVIPPVGAPAIAPIGAGVAQGREPHGCGLLKRASEAPDIAVAPPLLEGREQLPQPGRLSWELIPGAPDPAEQWRRRDMAYTVAVAGEPGSTVGKNPEGTQDLGQHLNWRCQRPRCSDRLERCRWDTTGTLTRLSGR